MKILFLSADAGIPVRGPKGAAVHIRSMAAAFSRLGHKVTLITPKPGPLDGEPVAGRVLAVPEPHPDLVETNGSAPREAGAIWRAVSVRETALAALRNEAFDLVYERHSLWSEAGAAVQAAFGIPFVLELNAPLRLEAARFRELGDAELAARIEARQFRAADAIAAVSQAAADYAVEAGAHADRVRVVPNGVDPQLFHPAVGGGKVHARYGLHAKKLVGFVGTARPWHDLDTLLRAFARLFQADRSYHLLLVGRMPENLEGRLSELGLLGAVTMTGPVPHAEVPAHIAALTVAVSSHQQMDGFYFSPLKVFEYLACGVPTVAADLGQPSALIEAGVHGELYTPGDAESLAEKIDRLARDRAYAAGLGWRGAVRVLENHTWDRNAALVCSWVRPEPPGPITAHSSKLPDLPILDEKLKQRLYRATRADLAQPLLRRRAPLRKSRTPLTGIEVLKYKAGRRCVLRYTWTHPSGREAGRAIGKVFRDGRGRRLDEVQRILFENGLDRGLGRVPRPLGYLPKMRMQLQEDAPGKTLNDLYRIGDIAAQVPLCSRGLARLHRLAAGLGENERGRLDRLIGTYFLEAERRSLAEIQEKLVEMKPDDAGVFQAMYTHLVAWSEQLPEADEAALVHRDFYYSQVLIDGGRLAIIDLDLLAWGDPAIDVANFSAHLSFLGLEVGGDFNALEEQAARFKRVYSEHAGVGPGFWERAAFYEAATLFRLLRVVAARPQKEPIYAPLLAHTTGAFENA